MTASLDQHRIIVRLAAKLERPYLERLMVSYLYDMTEFMGEPQRELEYEYPEIERYWLDANRYPFFIEYDTMRIGFALVIEHEHRTAMSEFFVPRHFRRHGIGTDSPVAGEWPRWPPTQAPSASGGESSTSTPMEALMRRKKKTGTGPSSISRPETCR